VISYSTSRLIAMSIAILPLFASAQPAGHSEHDVQRGTVERAWADGFRLNTGSRAFDVDTWEVFGDNTRRYVSVGDRVEVSGEFSGTEFDAFSVTAIGGR